MSDQEINIAIAEACGWAHADVEPYAFPDYCNDLNAMHEAEKVLVEIGVNKWWTYAGHILRHNPSPFGAETAIHATARQRAEAFLRTIGKWEEAEK